MKRIILLSLAVLALMLAGCRYAPESLKLSAKKLELSAEQSTELITSKNHGLSIEDLFITNSDFKPVEECEVKVKNGIGIESSRDWITVKLEDDFTVSVTVKENETGCARYALLKLDSDSHDTGSHVNIVQKS